MQAIVYHRYGSPDVLRLEDVPRPEPAADEALVRVRAAAVNAGDRHLMRGTPLVVRPMAGGMLKPRLKALGADLAGDVERVGAAVTHLRPGDRVFGHLSAAGFGAFAEYVSVRADLLLAKPAGLSYGEAAAVPGAGLAALQGLRYLGRSRAGQRVLINGASGGVGTFAVQIAKVFGARVTGVCSTGNLRLVRSLGADHVIDYTREDFRRGQRQYDLILDAAAFRSPWRLWRLLRPGGTYVLVGGAAAPAFQVMLFGRPVSRLVRRTLTLLLTKPSVRDLALLRDLVESRVVVPVIDRRYPLGEVPDAMRYLETGRARGKVIIDVAPPLPP